MPAPPGRPGRPPFPAKRRASHAAPGSDSGPDTRSAPSPASGGTAENIRQLDEKLLHILAERTRLAVEAGTMPVRVEQEMRAFWDSQAQRHKLKPTVLRQMLALANSLALDLAHRSADKIMRLPQAPGPFSLDARGLGSPLHTRLWALLAAAAGQDITLSPVVLSDPLVELVKALNQAGGNLSWETETIRNRMPGSPKRAGLEFEGAKVFAGHDSLNLYLLLALAIGHPGSCRFSGGAELKMLDLASFNGPVFSKLGARVAPVTPSSRGLPARVEAGGTMTDTLELPADCPPDLALALTTMAWTYEAGLTLVYGGQPALAQAVNLGAGILAEAGINAEVHDDRVTVPPMKPSLPKTPPAQLDPVSTLSLLALVRVVGDGKAQAESSVRLTGHLAKTQAVSAGLNALEAVGLKVELTDDAVSATVGAGPESVRLECPEPDVVPLAAGLAASAPRGATLVLPEIEAPAVEAILRDAGKAVTVSTQDGTTTLDISPGSMAEPGTPVVAPSPAWAMALSLFNFTLPPDMGLALANPGVMTELWPGYWALLGRLATPGKRITSLTKPQDEDDTDDGQSKRRRRIVVR